MDEKQIQTILHEVYKPVHYKIHDWSHRHGSDHAEKLSPLQRCFDLLIVSDAFQGKSLIQRHRMVYQSMGMGTDESGLHSLTVNAFTPEEWKKRNS